MNEKETVLSIQYTPYFKNIPVKFQKFDSWWKNYAIEVHKILRCVQLVHMNMMLN